MLAVKNLHDHHHHHRPTYPGPQSIFDRHLASSYEESERHPDDHNLLQVRAVISRPNNKENKKPSVTLYHQNI